MMRTPGPFGSGMMGMMGQPDLMTLLLLRRLDRVDQRLAQVAATRAVQPEVRTFATAVAQNRAALLDHSKISVRSERIGRRSRIVGALAP